MAEGRGQTMDGRGQVEGREENAQSKSSDGKRWQQKKQRAKQRSNTCEHTQVSGAKRSSLTIGPHRGQRVEGRGQRACIGHTASCQSATNGNI